MDPLTLFGISSIGSGFFSGLGSIIGQSSANSANREIAQENREWQSHENQINRDWQSDQNQINRDWNEKMWNAQNVYNSPSAMMSRLRDAGINPFVLGGSSGVATAGAAGSAGSPSAGSPSMVGAPSAPTMMPVNYGAPIANALNNYLQVKGVEANAANQSAQSFKTLMEGATEAYKIGGHQAYRSYVNTAAPLLIGSNPDFGLIDRMASQQLRESVARTNAQEFQTSLAKEFGPKQANQAIMESEQRISEIVGRLNTMRVANDALIRKTASECVKMAAEAFNLRQQGNYYIATKDQINALRPYLERVVKSQAEMSEIQSDLTSANRESLSGLIGYATSSEGKENLKESYRIKSVRRADYLWTAVHDLFNDMIHVGVGAGASDRGLNTTIYE